MAGCKIDNCRQTTDFHQYLNPFVTDSMSPKKSFDMHYKGLVPALILMPCPFTGPKMFWASPIFLCQTKNLFTYCGSRKHLTFLPD